MASLFSPTLMLGSLQLGLIYGLLALGVFISFRILNIPDLTADGSFTLGLAVSAVCSVAGHPLLGLVLAELRREGKVAWACVTNAMFERAGALRCDTERIVNYLIEIEGVEIAALATEQEDGASAKFSLRSVAPYNVARDVAQPLGGGGHERAAGITIHRPLSEAVDLVLSRIREVV